MAQNFIMSTKLRLPSGLILQPVYIAVGGCWPDSAWRDKAPLTNGQRRT